MILPFFLKIKMDGNPSLSVIIPSDLIRKFTDISSRNLSSRDGKLVETLAFAIGSIDIDLKRLIVSHLIIPRQTSLPASVEDKGKTYTLHSFRVEFISKIFTNLVDCAVNLCFNVTILNYFVQTQIDYAFHS